MFGDPAGRSNILFIRSDNDGANWTSPIQANPTVVTDRHHVLPSLDIDTDPNDVHVAYYTQHGDETVDVDLANSHDSGDSFPGDRVARVTSTNFVLPPTVLRLTAGPTPTTNYDRLIVSPQPRRIPQREIGERRRTCCGRRPEERHRRSIR